MKRERNKLMLLVLRSILLCMMILLVVPGIRTEAASKIELNKKSVSVYKGKTYKLKIKNVKAGQKIAWKSSKPKIAAIKVNGTTCTITGKKAGKAVVSAKVGKTTYKCNVTVKEQSAALSAKKKTITKGENFTLSLKNASSSAKWSVSDKKVLKIKKLAKNKYQVTGLKAGSAKVYAKLGDKKYTCSVTVKAAASPAEKVPSCVGEQTVYGYSSMVSGVIQQIDIPDCFIFIKDLDENAKVIDITSSNPHISARKRSGIDAVEVDGNIDYRDESQRKIDLLNMTSTIRFKVIQNGKTYDLSCNIIVKALPSPFSSLKVGDYEIADEFTGVMTVGIWGKNIQGKQKLSIEMAPGYILDDIVIVRNNGGSIDTNVIKNGSVIDFGTWMNIHITINYHTTKKPANYKEPKSWDAVAKSPLHSWMYLEV